MGTLTRHVAFLRAINVGGHTVTMGRLVELFEALGLDDVTTFIASGNVIFTSRSGVAALERRIDQHLQSELGYPAEVFLRTPDELQAILSYPAFPAKKVASAHALMIGFLRQKPSAAVAKAVTRLGGEADQLVINGRELYWLRPVQESDPKLGKLLERALGGPMTVRNVNTVRRLVAKYGKTP